MALTGDTGNGATLTLALYNGTTAITTALSVISISPGKITTKPIDVTVLGTTGFREMIPGDLAEIGESSANFKWLTNASIPTTGTATGTCTLTFPLRGSETTAATMTGTGFITGLQPPVMENGKLQEGTINWQWDGDTGPSFTASA